MFWLCAANKAWNHTVIDENRKKYCTSVSFLEHQPYCALNEAGV